MANGYYGMSFEDRGPSPIPQDRPLVGGTTNVIDLSSQTPEVAISSDEQDDYQQFLTTTGRSDFNPYGDAGIFGAKADYRNQLSPQRIAQLNRQAFDQYRGLVSGQGTQRGGRGPRVPGYAPALKIGSDTPMGRVAVRPTTPRGGIAGLASFIPGVSIIQGLLGGGNRLRTLDDMGVNYSTEGVDAAMGTAPVQAAPSTVTPVTPATTSMPSISDVFTPFTTDAQGASGAVDYDGYPEMYDPFAVRGTVDRGIFESDDEAAAFEELTGVQTQVPVTAAEILATPPVSRLVPESTYRPIFTDDVMTTPPVVSDNRVVQTRKGRIPNYIPNLEAPATASRESVLSSATDRLGGAIDEFEDVAQRMEFFQDAYDELYPDRLSATIPTSTAPTDLTAGVGEELLGTRLAAPIDRSDDPAFARVLQSMLKPTDVAQMRERDARIDAIRIPLIAQGLPPALALKRAREQVGG